MINISLNLENAYFSMRQKNHQSRQIKRCRCRSKMMFKFRSWRVVVDFAVDASPKAPTVGKPIHGTLILGVLPRNTTAKPTTHLHLLNDITFLAGEKKKSQKTRIKPKPEFEFFLLLMLLFHQKWEMWCGQEGWMVWLAFQGLYEPRMARMSATRTYLQRPQKS